MKRILLCFLCLLTVALCIPVQAAESDEITVFYTNDVNSNIDKTLNYATIAALKSSYKAAGKNVLVVDAGDYTQGTVYGAEDEGENCLRLMNLAGYDVATFGNHEFDYGIERFYEIAAEAQFATVACNLFYKNADGSRGERFTDAYKVYTFGKTKVAIVGIITPATPSLKMSADELYFAGRYDTQELYDEIQTTIDAAKKEADFVIAIAHCGIGTDYVQFSSEAIIRNVSGLSAFIDGHSHTVCESQDVKDKAGNTVLLTQTGGNFSAIGQMTIQNGKISAKLLEMVDVEDDVTVKEATEAWIAEIEKMWDTKIVETEIAFTINGADGKRAIRKTETNIGDFVADAYYWYLNEVSKLPCDIAVVNGGGVRVSLTTGDLLAKDFKEVVPFGNIVCVATVTGQEILDYLEYSTRNASATENGGYMQVTGLTYELHTYIPSTVQCDAAGVWSGSPTGEYRVKNIRIYNKETGTYEPIDLDRTYSVGSTTYALYEGGDGNVVFSKCGYTLINDDVEQDVVVLMAYCKAFADTDGDGYPELASKNSPLADYAGYMLNYESPTGAGRVTEQATRTAISIVGSDNVISNIGMYRRFFRKVG